MTSENLYASVEECKDSSRELLAGALFDSVLHFDIDVEHEKRAGGLSRGDENLRRD